MIENPTGSCTAQSSGARRGLPLPGEGDVWLPDCDRGGLREYWRVFRRPSGTAYVVPNPTLPPQYYVSACADLGNPLFEIVSRYSFCNDLTLPETQNRVASMTPADAMTVAREYHRLLSFGFYSPGILPEPVLGDVLDACELGTSEDSPEFQSVTCEHARAVSRGGGADAGAIPTQDWIGQGGADLAFHLNKLYGIDSQRMTLSIAPELCGLPADPASCTAPGPRYFYDLQIAACAVRPFGSCGSGIADFATEDACRGACALRAHRCMRCDSGGLCGQHDDCGACPLTKPDSGIPCGEIGLRCDYGLTCGAECTCQTDGTWSCVFLLC